MFNAIPSKIFNMLAKVSSITKKNAQTRIEEGYQVHNKALPKAYLDPMIFPTLKEIWKKSDASKINNDAKREKRIRGQGPNVYFYIGFYKI